MCLDIRDSLYSLSQNDQKAEILMRRKNNCFVFYVMRYVIFVL